MVLGGRKANSNKLILRRYDRLQIILDVVVRSKVDANLIRTDWALEGCPLTVTAVTIVSLNTRSIVETG